jgi:aldehyde oxidoreductase
MKGGNVEKKVLTINGVPHMMVIDPEASLASVLREQLGLTGTKVGCGTGHCGSCAVILDGNLVRSCVTKICPE